MVDLHSESCLVVRSGYETLLSVHYKQAKFMKSFVVICKYFCQYVEMTDDTLLLGVKRCSRRSVDIAYTMEVLRLVLP